MAEAGINTVRTYTVPGRSAARRSRRARPAGDGRRAVDAARRLPRRSRPGPADPARRGGGGARARRRIPASLLFALGNEIPPAVVRWHGQRAHRAVPARAVRRGEGGIARRACSPTSTSRPPSTSTSTSFDVCAFNVYLHREPELRAYLARLQHVAGDRPLLLAEAGADSIREGVDGPGRASPPCTSARRSPKARAARSRSPGPTSGGAAGTPCTTGRSAWSIAAAAAEAGARGGARGVRRGAVRAGRARGMAEGVGGGLRLQRRRHDRRLPHARSARSPTRDFEIIVVNDGSRDDTGDPRAAVPGRPGHRHPERRPERGAQRRPGRGHRRDRRLHRRRRARRSRLAHLSGAADAHVGRSSAPAARTSCRADDPWVAQCVARAPGGPTHVLLDDRDRRARARLQHGVPPRGADRHRRVQPRLPARRRRRGRVLAAAGQGLQDRLRARRRSSGITTARSVKAYWRQQVGYGEGETWLDAAPSREVHRRPDAVARPHLQPAAVRPLAVGPAHQHRRVGHGGLSRRSTAPTSTRCSSCRTPPSWMAASTLLCLAGVPAALVVAYPVEALLLLGARAARLGHDHRALLALRRALRPRRPARRHARGAAGSATAC